MAPAWGFDPLWEKAAAQAREGAAWAPKVVLRRQVVRGTGGEEKSRKEERWELLGWEEGRPKYRGLTRKGRGGPKPGGELNPFLMSAGDTLRLDRAEDVAEGEGVVRRYYFRQKHPQWGWMAGVATLDPTSGSPYRLEYSLLEPPSQVKDFALRLDFTPCRPDFVVPGTLTVRVVIRALVFNANVELREEYRDWVAREGAAACGSLLP